MFKTPIQLIYIFIFYFNSLAAQPSELAEYEIDPIKGIKASDVVHWQLASASELSSGSVEVILYLSTEGGFTLYQEKLQFLASTDYAPEEIIYPPTTELIDPVTGNPVNVFNSGEFRVFYKKLSNNRSENFSIKIRYIACTDKICLFPFTQELSSPLILSANYNPSSTNNDNDLASFDSDKIDLDSKLAKKFSDSDSIALLLLLVFVGGLLTNLTPCVFPMIPITMRVLASQANAPFKASSLYAAGILVTYSTLGIFAASTGSLFGSLMANKTFNLVFAILMFVFAVTMLGFGNLSKLQLLGSKIGSNTKPSLKNAFFMGTGAGLVASPCTGPILAALLTYAANKNDFYLSSLLMVTYSFGFALPYVFLGTLSGNLHKVRLSGGIQISVKILFAGVMIALGFYYLRIPMYSTFASLKSSWLLISLISLPLGLGLLLLTTFNSKLHLKKYFQLIPAFLIGLGLLSGINARYESSKKQLLESGFKWIYSEELAYKEAKENNKFILIDNWAEWCEACKKMDVTTFVAPEVINELTTNWVGLKLDFTESTDDNDALMVKYNIPSLPTLILIPPSGDLKKAKRILGYINHHTLLQHMSEFKKENTLD